MSMIEADLTKIQDALNVLCEHFDAVHIFASRHEPETEDGTVSVQKGVGNWYARYGQITEWMVKQDEFARINCRENP
jgi:hypothetical protein